jgi:hypothetical protein
MFSSINNMNPSSTLGYGTNNKYNNFPPLMSDGRSITASAQTAPLINADLRKHHNITSNWEYRQYLTHNAKNVMNYNLSESSNDVGYYTRFAKGPPGNTVEVERPIISDLKETYLSREQLNARKIAPVIIPTVNRR